MARAGKSRGARKAPAKKRPARGGKPGHPHVPSGPRALWSGTITFALVSVPVDLYPASRDASPRTRLLAPDGTPLESRWVCPDHERELAWSSIDRAQETDSGFVVLSDAELEAIEPRRSRDIEIGSFVPLASIDPLMVESSFVLVPSSGPTKPYRLLARALEQKQLVGLATFVMRRRERLTAVLAREGVLWAVALRFREDVRTAAQAGARADARPSSAVVRKWRASLRALTKPRWSPNALRDEAAQELRKLVERKRRSKQGVVRVEREPAAEREDDTELLETGAEDNAAPQGVFELIRERMRATPRARKPAKSRARGPKAVARRARGA